MINKGSYYSSWIAEILVSSVKEGTAPQTVSKKEPSIALSDREKQLLKFLATDRTTREIGEKLFNLIHE